MSDRKKDEKQLLLFPHQELGTKPNNEVWMQWETKLLAQSVNNFSIEVVYLPHGSLCYQVLKNEYVIPFALVSHLCNFQRYSIVITVIYSSF